MGVHSMWRCALRCRALRRQLALYMPEVCVIARGAGGTARAGQRLVRGGGAHGSPSQHPTAPPVRDSAAAARTQVGSTLVFDAQRLRALGGEEAAPGDDAERLGGVGDPLVCVTTKRLRLQPALPAATT